MAEATTEYVFRSSLQALAWNEFAKTKPFALRSLLSGVVPSILIGGLLLPFNAATTVLVFIVFGYLAGISVCGNRETTTVGGSTLPYYLLTSPLTSAQIAWTRAAVWLGLVASIFGCVLVVFLLWALWPSNRQAWLQWAAEQATLVGGEASELHIGLRLSAAIVLAVTVFAISRIAAYWWIGMSGRNWFVVLMTIVSAAVYLIPFAWFLQWFTVQTQWSAVQAALQNLLDVAPQLIAGLLVVKAVSSAAVAAISTRSQLVSSVTIGWIVMVWTIVVLLLSITLALLIPYPSATFAKCWGATALAIPLARVLVMPWMVDWNRHR